MKRISIGIFALLALLTIFCVESSSESSADPISYEEGGLTYTLSEGGGQYYAEVTSYDKITNEITIKSSLDYEGNTYRVVSVSADIFKETSLQTVVIESNDILSLTTGMFDSCIKLTSVTIGEGVKEIPTLFCYRCSALQSVSLPTSVVSIGESAFAYCNTLDGVTLGANVTTIMDGAFQGCSSLKAIEFPDSVVNLGLRTFNQCTSLANIKLGENLTSLPANTFGDTTIKTITIPSKVTSIDRTSALPKTLVSITVDENNPVFESKDGVLYKKEDGSLFIWPAAKGGEVTLYDVPSSILSNNKLVTKVIVSEGVINIGQSAFSNCSALTEITLPSTLTSIEASAFNGCSSLVAIQLPSGVTSLSHRCFADCSKLTDINLEHITELGNNVFNNCTSLTTIDLSSIAVMDSGTLNGCTSITDVIWPSKITAIPDYTFNGCSKLSSVQLPSITSVGGNAFAGSGIVNINLSSAKTIGIAAFKDCSSLESVILSDDLVVFEQAVFQNCSKLQLTHLPKNLETINKWSLMGIGSEILYVGEFDKKVTLVGGMNSAANRLISGGNLKTLVLDNVNTTLTAKKIVNYTETSNLENVVITDRFVGSSFFDESNGLESMLSTSYPGKIILKSIASSESDYFLVTAGDTKKLEDPVAPEGKDFGGWYKDSEFTQQYDSTEKLTANITVYAKYVPKEYRITIFGEGITVKNGDNVVVDGSKIAFETSLSIAFEERVGYKAIVKMDGAVVSDVTVNVPAKDFVISCEWVSIPYTVKCIDGETVIKAIENCRLGDVITLPVVDKAGFSGWAVENGMLLGAQYVVSYGDVATDDSIILNAIFLDPVSAVSEWSLTVTGDGIDGKVFWTKSNSIGSYGMITVVPGQFERPSFEVSENGGYGIISDTCIMVYSNDGKDVSVTVKFSDVGKASDYTVSLVEIVKDNAPGFRATVSADEGYVDTDGTFSIRYVYKVYDEENQVWAFTTSGQTTGVDDAVISLGTEKASKITGDFVLDVDGAYLVYGYASYSFKDESAGATVTEVVASPVIMSVSEIQAVTKP